MSDWMSGPGGADEAIARVQDQIAAAKQRAAQATALRGELEAVRGRASSLRGEVSVTTDTGGAPLEVELGERAMELDPRDLGRLIVETAAAARRDAGQRAVALAGEAFGENSSVVAHLREEVAQRSSGGEAGLHY